MNNQRYLKLVQYKSALDKSYQKSGPTELYNNDYDDTLRQAKLDGFKVERNSKGKHRLTDKTNGKPSTAEAFNELFGGVFGDIFT